MRQKRIVGIVLAVALLISGLMIFDLPSMATGGSGNSARSKKGLQVDFNIMSDVEELGIDEGFINIEFEKLLEKDPKLASPENAAFAKNLADKYIQAGRLTL